MNINYKNGIKIINLLHLHFSNQEDDLGIVEYPTQIEYASSEWLYYMFYSCLLNYGIRSKTYHKNLINTYNDYPEIFNLKYVVDNFSDNKEVLANVIKNNIHPRYPNIALNKWLNLSSELSKYDNLIDKIKDMKNFYELNLFIKSINGYGQKTGGLLLRLIYESKICNFTDDILSIPLDRHDIEISYLTDIINQKKLTEKQIKLLSDTFIKIGKELDISPNLIDKYLWEIGNSFCNKKDCLNCPLYQNCKTKLELYNR